MKRSLAFLSLPIVLLSACSEPPSEPDKSAIDGHWLYNPGQCEQVIEPNGMFDLKISERAIYFGDSKKAAEGKWTKSSSESASDIKSRVGEWRNSCENFDVAEQKIANADVFYFDGKYQQAYFLNYGGGWFMASEDDLYWLVPFQSVKDSGMPVNTVEQEQN